ncbi:hypothetical protein BS17DRAFT_25443 [Gyrodon lividus]|nr:hypothetical protein BS17DRAFT_25443 [Gyrodon lividus]
MGRHNTVQSSAPQPSAVTVITVSLGPFTTTPTAAPGITCSRPPSSSLIPLFLSSSISGVMPTFSPQTSEITISTTPSSSSPLSAPAVNSITTNVPVVTPTTLVPPTLTRSISSALHGSTTPVFSLTPLPPAIPVPSSASTTSLPPTDSAATAPSPASPFVSVTPYPSEAAAQTPKLTPTLIAIITVLSFLALLSLVLGVYVFTRTRRQRRARIQRQREIETRALTSDSMHLVTSSSYGGTQSTGAISISRGRPAPPRPRNPYEGIIPPHIHLLPSDPGDNPTMHLTMPYPRPQTAS